MVPQLVKGFRRLEPAGPPGVYLLVAAYRMGRAPYPGVGSHSGEKVFVLRVKSTRSLFKILGLKMWEKKKHAHSDSSGIRARSGLYRIEVKSELERNRTGSGSDQDGIGTRSEPDGNRIEKTWVTLMGTRLKKHHCDLHTNKGYHGLSVFVGCAVGKSAATVQDEPWNHCHNSDSGHAFGCAWLQLRFPFSISA